MVANETSYRREQSPYNGTSNGFMEDLRAEKLYLVIYRLLPVLILASRSPFTVSLFNASESSFKMTYLGTPPSSNCSSTLAFNLKFHSGTLVITSVCLGFPLSAF